MLYSILATLLRSNTHLSIEKLMITLIYSNITTVDTPIFTQWNTVVIYTHITVLSTKCLVH